MKKSLFFVSALVMLSGCYMIPMAFIGPAASNFTTASILQSTMSTGANYLVNWEITKRTCYGRDE